MKKVKLLDELYIDGRMRNESLEMNFFDDGEMLIHLLCDEITLSKKQTDEFFAWCKEMSEKIDPINGPQ